jgi:hypothetical protein
MKTKLIIALTFFVMMSFLFGGAARAQENPSGSSGFSEHEAINIAQEWASLVGQANVAELEKLLNDQYMHIHGTSLVESKTQFLDAFKNGSRKYDPITLEEVKVRTFGNSAVVTGKFNLKAFFRDKTIEGINRFGLILVKTQNGPQVVSFQATPIPQPKS